MPHQLPRTGGNHTTREYLTANTARRANRRSEPGQQQPAHRFSCIYFQGLSSFCALKRWVDFQRMKPGNHPWDTGRQNFLERREGRTSLVLPHSVSAPSAPPAAKLSLNPIISGIKNSISAKVVQRGSDSFIVPQHSPFPV